MSSFTTTESGASFVMIIGTSEMPTLLAGCWAIACKNHMLYISMYLYDNVCVVCYKIGINELQLSF